MSADVFASSNKEIEEESTDRYKKLLFQFVLIFNHNLFFYVIREILRFNKKSGVFLPQKMMGIK